MPELPQDVWFYSRDGDRRGPVSLTELRAIATEGGLNPRLDLVWTQGMPDWKPAGEIEVLFERCTSATPAAANPYTPPQTESFAELMHRQAEWPGARRRAYLTATILLPILWNVALVTGPAVLGMPLEPAVLHQVTLGGTLLLCLIGLYYGLQRLANLGMSRWWYFGFLVPVLNLWVGYRCFACPAGYAYHKRLDGIGIALAIFYWLLVGVGILAVIALIVIMIRFANDPRMADLLRQLRDAIEQARAAPAAR
jgi:hypothetical protein